MYPIRTYKTPTHKNRRYPVDMFEVTMLNYLGRKWGQRNLMHKEVGSSRLRTRNRFASLPIVWVLLVFVLLGIGLDADS
jgi:hypothetical protein